MTRRHTITLGAPTTSNGSVVSASSSGTIDGVPIALEGDRVYCRACKTEGHIVCVGPRLTQTWNGIPVALEDDLCICRCPTPPRLIPSQTSRFQKLGGQAGDASGAPRG